MSRSQASDSFDTPAPGTPPDRLYVALSVVSLVLLASADVGAKPPPTERTPHLLRITLGDQDAPSAQGALTLSASLTEELLGWGRDDARALRRYVSNRIDLRADDQRCRLEPLTLARRGAAPGDEIKDSWEFRFEIHCPRDLTRQNITVVCTLFAAQRHHVPTLLEVRADSEAIERYTFDASHARYPPPGDEVSGRTAQVAARDARKKTRRALFALLSSSLLALLAFTGWWRRARARRRGDRR